MKYCEYAPSLASLLHLSMLTQLDLNLGRMKKCHPIFLDFDASNPGPEVLRRQQAVRLRQARPGLHPGLRININIGSFDSASLL